jgi:hypothetical protein
VLPSAPSVSAQSCGRQNQRRSVGGQGARVSAEGIFMRRYCAHLSEMVIVHPTTPISPQPWAGGQLAARCLTTRRINWNTGLFRQWVLFRRSQPARNAVCSVRVTTLPHVCCQAHPVSNSAMYIIRGAIVEITCRVAFVGDFSVRGSNPFAWCVGAVRHPALRGHRRDGRSAVSLQLPAKICE